jgi:hypothetical protein
VCGEREIPGGGAKGGVDSGEVVLPVGADDDNDSEGRAAADGDHGLDLGVLGEGFVLGDTVAVYPEVAVAEL